jgi:hypothetical protein
VIKVFLIAFSELFNKKIQLAQTVSLKEICNLLIDIAKKYILESDGQHRLDQTDLLLPVRKDQIVGILYECFFQ